MKVAISHPSTFSRVRRGTERFVHELGRYLAARGHEVRVITNTAGARELIPIDGYVEDRRRRLWHPLLGKAGIDASRAFLLTSLAEFARPRYDVIQACSNLDAFAAATLRRLTGVPCAYFVNALPPPVRYYQGLSGGGALFRRAVRGCSEVVALSRFIQTNLERLCGRGGIVLPVPVDTEVFRLASGARPRHPVILCAAALDDGRKGGATLMRAFDRLKARRPTARLVVSSTIPDAVREQLLGLV
ncbi:MAG: glycosyltransferase family 4 protein, partial [Ectothiorhodospiraceae bacterium]|nr:glycosyltransferase family 4 protein [Ectothiorhodospiraceae bacterium]